VCEEQRPAKMSGGKAGGGQAKGIEEERSELSDAETAVGAQTISEGLIVLKLLIGGSAGYAGSPMADRPGSDSRRFRPIRDKAQDRQAKTGRQGRGGEKQGRRRRRGKEYARAMSLYESMWRRYARHALRGGRRT